MRPVLQSQEPGPYGLSFVRMQLESGHTGIDIMLGRLARQGVTLGALCVLCAAASGPSGPPSYSQQATVGVRTLQQWYSQTSGPYAPPSGWWNAANAITVLANYSGVTGSKQYLSAIPNTFKNANKANGAANCRVALESRIFRKSVTY